MEKKLLRDKLQKGIYKVIDPIVKGLIKIGLTPNAVTTIGLILNIGVAVIFIAGAEKGNRGDLRYVGWAGALVLFAGLFDMLDGQVARLGNMSSTFGALFDSVLDRYSEFVMFLGICYYLVSHHYFISSLFAFIALIGSMMVSYTRARSEGLGIENKGGLMQRPERVVLVGVSAIACGITANIIGGDYKLFIPGIRYHVFETMSVFTLPITVMAVLTNITAFKRLFSAKKALEEKEKKVTILRNTQKTVLLLLIIFFSPVVTIIAQEKFPVPVGNPNQLFYLQRTANTNTIVVELNHNNGILNTEDPIHVFWLRYTDQGQREELNYIQRKFAYGVKATFLEKDKYQLQFVSYKKFLMYLMKGNNNKYNVYATINQKQAILHRIFVKINGGSFWSPNIEYVEIKGIDPANGKEVVERMKI